MNEQSRRRKEDAAYTSDEFYKTVLGTVVNVSGKWIETADPHGKSRSIALSTRNSGYYVRVSWNTEDEFTHYHLTVNAVKVNNLGHVKVDIDTTINLKTKQESFPIVKTTINDVETHDDQNRITFLQNFLNAKYDHGATHVLEVGLKRRHGADKVSRINR